MTREDLLKDEWVKENFGDACYPNYLEPNFEVGVEYGERKAIERACEWLSFNMTDTVYMGCHGREVLSKPDLLQNLRKAMEE